MKKLLIDEGRELVTLNNPIGLLTIKEVADFLKVSVPTVRRLQQGRHVPFIKVGGCLRFNKREIVLYLKRRTINLVE
jgi:excisionase family DNA binding protein